jgi:hypothetical protein
VIRFFWPLFTAFVLSLIAIFRTDGFSPSLIEANLEFKEASPLNPDIKEVLSQPFYYLGKGRQSFVFQSGDGQFVLKFYNQKYLRMPWYSFLVYEKEFAKRSRRRHFYENSYEIAFKELGEEILYLHRGFSQDLPKIVLKDRASRCLAIDLNEVPFVLQRKGEPFYPVLQAIYKKDGTQGVCKEIDQFLASISLRISKNIADADCDVEHNWGYVGSRLFHLDPGRLFYDSKLKEPARLDREWHNSTHDLHQWLKANYPEAALYLQSELIKMKTQSQ